jgi:hypothetical protein
VEHLRHQRDGQVRATPLRDAEVEEYPAQDEEGDRVLLPLERAAEDVAPPDFEQRQQGGADEKNRRGGARTRSWNALQAAYAFSSVTT